MSDMLIRPPGTIPEAEIYDQELLDRLQCSLEEHWYSGPKAREHINSELHRDIQEGGVLSVIARLELFLGRIASISSRS